MALEGLDLQTLIDGGSTGIAVLLIAYMMLKDRNSVKETMSQTDVLRSITNEISKSNAFHDSMIQVLDRNTTTHERAIMVLEKSIYVIERMENHIEKIRGVDVK